VQGEGAARKIAAALRDVNRRNNKLLLDVLIVGRGGGSPEDLWAFNEEVLARAIYDSKIPVISAVGHEIDTTIADLVADERASTPTKAGVVAVPDMQEVLERLAAIESRLAGEITARLELTGQKLQTLLASSVFRNPLLPVHNRTQEVDDLQAVLSGSVRELLVKAKEKIAVSYEQVRKIEPHRLLGRKLVELNNWQSMANSGIKGIINNCRMKLTAAANRLAGLNPKSVLERGFSITTSKKTGMVVRSLSDIEIEDLLITELARENLIESKVTNKVKSEK
jgi:exodeoxyribonuclease VII large subunit